MADHQSSVLAVASKSKLKRLNRKLKALRVETELKREKNLRASAEKRYQDWRGKALEYRRKISKSEAVKLATIASTTSCKIRLTNPVLASISHSISTFVPKATPSVPNRSGSFSAIILDDSTLRNPSTAENFIGSGRFGSCIHMVFKNCFDVCVKKFDSISSINAIKAEASILSLLNTGDFTPHCFGISINMRALVMSYISVDGQPLPLHIALSNGTFDLDHPTVIDCLLSLAKALEFIHTKQILHNDLKHDNIVLGTTKYSNLRPYIVDFGKACFVSAARAYHLKEDEKAEHKLNHTQIAPDLRDGLVKQSVSSDIYSLGRIFKRMNSTTIKSDNFSVLIKRCLQYHSCSRPCIMEIITTVETLSLE